MGQTVLSGRDATGEHQQLWKVATAAGAEPHAALDHADYVGQRTLLFDIEFADLFGETLGLRENNDKTGRVGLEQAAAALGEPGELGEPYGPVDVAAVREEVLHNAHQSLARLSSMAR